VLTEDHLSTNKIMRDGLRDPSNTSRAFREARDAAGFSSGDVARLPRDGGDDPGRSRAQRSGGRRPTRPLRAVDDAEVYVGRRVANLAAAAALEAALSDLAATGQDDRAVTDSADRVE